MNNYIKALASQNIYALEFAMYVQKLLLPSEGYSTSVTPVNYPLEPFTVPSAEIYINDLNTGAALAKIWLNCGSCGTVSICARYVGNGSSGMDFYANSNCNYCSPSLKDAAERLVEKFTKCMTPGGIHQH